MSWTNPIGVVANSSEGCAARSASGYTRPWSRKSSRYLSTMPQKSSFGTRPPKNGTLAKSSKPPKRTSSGGKRALIEKALISPSFAGEHSRRDLGSSSGERGGSGADRAGNGHHHRAAPAAARRGAGVSCSGCGRNESCALLWNQGRKCCPDCDCLPISTSPPEAVAAEPRGSAVTTQTQGKRAEAWTFYRLRLQTLLLSCPSEGCRSAAERTNPIELVANPIEVH